MTTKTKAIRALNDELRQNLTTGTALMTAGVAALGAETVVRIVKTIAVFNEKNPQPNVCNFILGPRAGRAEVSTRIRLADSQKITAIAHLADGSFWSVSVDIIVTLAACTEEVI